MRRLILLLTISLSYIPVIKSQGRLDSVQLIPEVIVQGIRSKEVISPQRLSGKKLEGLSTYSVADALRYFSGIQIKDYGGIGGVKTINIRSMGSHHVGVFYDGIQLGNAQNGQIDLGKFSLDNMDEISLYNGQKSQIFQSAKDFGSSGTIYLRTRRPHFESGQKYHLRAAFRTGSFGLANPSLLWEQKISSRLSASMSTEFINAHGKYKFRYKRVLPNGEVAHDTTATRHNGDVRSLRAEASLFGSIDRGQWNLKAYYYDSERGIPGAIVNNNFQSWERLWDRNFFTQGSFEKQLWHNYRLRANIKYAYDYTHYLRPDDKLRYTDNVYKQQEQYVSVANLYTPFPWWELSLSADFQWNTLDANLNDFAYPTRYTELIALATSFQIRDFKLQGSILGTFVQEHVVQHKAAAAAPNKQVFSPALFLSWRPEIHPALSLHAFYKQCFRMPTFNDLYYTDIGNSYLKPEYTTQYDIGLSYEKRINHSFFHSIRLLTDIYYNEVENKIIASPSGPMFRWMMRNLGEVEIRGIDFSLENAFHLQKVELQTRLTYTYQKAQDFSEPDEAYYGDQIPYIPWHSGSAGITAIYRGWQINYSFIYTGERYYESANIPIKRLQPWYTSDLAFSKKFNYRKVKYRVAAEVNNIFNQYFDVVYNYPMPGTNFKLIFQLEI